MLKQFLFGEFGIVVTDNPEMTSVVFEPNIDEVINNNNHDRMLFKNAFNALELQKPILKEMSLSLGPKLNKETMTDIEWLSDYLDSGYQRDYKFDLQSEGWAVKNVK